MAAKKRRDKVSYTVMILADSARKDNKEYHIRAGAVGIVTVSVFLLVVALSCYVVYSSIILSDVRSRNQGYLDEIAGLQEENRQLKEENQQLQETVRQVEGENASLAEAVSQQEETARAMAAEQEEARLPKGFPFNGTAQMKGENGEQDADTEEEHGLSANQEWQEIIFQSAEGINVIVSGTGTVLAVEEDTGSGCIVKVDHGNGYVSMYRNKGKAVVKVGDAIEKGDLVFLIEEENIELGFSIKKDGAYINPLDMLEIHG